MGPLGLEVGRLEDGTEVGSPVGCCVGKIEGFSVNVGLVVGCLEMQDSN